MSREALYIYIYRGYIWGYVYMNLSIYIQGFVCIDECIYNFIYTCRGSSYKPIYKPIRWRSAWMRI